MKYHLLKESAEIDQVLNQPFMKQFNELRLFRGIRNTSFDDITLVPFRFREKPLDTNRILHDKINELSENQFDVPIRNLIFSYTDAENASIYGVVYMIVPAGNDYKLFNEPDINDMTAQLGAGENFMDQILEMTIDNFHTVGIIEDIQNGHVRKIVENIMENLGFHTTDIKEEFYKFFTDNMKKFIDVHAKENDLDEQELKEIVDYIKNNNVIYKLSDMFGKLLDENIERMAEDYVNNIEEIDEDDDVNFDNHPEIMIYSPSGFYVIPPEYFSEFGEM